MPYHVERFHAAVLMLAGHGHIKQRLIQATQEHLDDIDEDELPVELTQEFADLKRTLHRVTPLRGESAVSATVRKMSVKEADECVAAVVSTYRAVLAYAQRGVQLTVHSEGERQTPPPFLVAGTHN